MAIEGNEFNNVKEGDSFVVKQMVVYPSHGVGCILGIEVKEIAGVGMKCFLLSFEKNRMTLLVPCVRAIRSGMRPLVSIDFLNTTFHEVFTAKKRTKKGIWNKRSQEYESKIASGDFRTLCEVVRDLHRSSKSSQEASFSEKQIYEAALGRLVEEIRYVLNVSHDKAISRIEDFLEGISQHEIEKNLTSENPSSKEALIDSFFEVV